MMTLQEFKTSLNALEAPSGLNPILKALWLDGKGDWNASHNIAQDMEDSLDGCWIHAYLHRKEGDKANASYWYRKAGKEFPKISLEKEWEEIVSAFLKREMK